jgi:hypothetical protein
MGRPRAFAGTACWRASEPIFQFIHQALGYTVEFHQVAFLQFDNVSTDVILNRPAKPVGSANSLYRQERRSRGRAPLEKRCSCRLLCCPRCVANSVQCIAKVGESMGIDLSRKQRLLQSFQLGDRSCHSLCSSHTRCCRFTIHGTSSTPWRLIQLPRSGQTSEEQPPS